MQHKTAEPVQQSIRKCNNNNKKYYLKVKKYYLNVKNSTKIVKIKIIINSV